MRRTVASVGALALVASVNVAASAADPIEIEVWHSLGDNNGGPEIVEMLADFNAQHDDIKATAVYVGGYADTLRKAQASLAAGSPPDLAMFEQTQGPAFVDAGVVVPLEDMIASDPDVDISDYHETLLASCTTDGHLWCIPFNTSTPLLYYNKDLFREVGLDPDEDVPETWDDLLEVGPKFAKYDAQGNLMQWAFNLRTSPGWMWDSFFLPAGGQFLNESGDGFILNNEAGVRAMQFWVELMEKDIAQPLGTTAGYDESFAGNVAMLFQSTAVLESYLNEANFDIGVAPMLCGEKCALPIGGATFYVFDQRDDAREQAAWQALKYLTSAEQGARFSAATGYMAPRKDSLETDTLRNRFRELPEAKFAYDQMRAYGVPRLKSPFGVEILTEISNAAQRVLLEGVSPQEALDDVADEGNRLLDVYSR